MSDVNQPQEPPQGLCSPTNSVLQSRCAGAVPTGVCRAALCLCRAEGQTRQWQGSPGALLSAHPSLVDQ